jgi:hypothetical protein
MARTRLTFRERDVAAAIKAAERGSGRKVHRVRIELDGSISVELAPTATNETAPGPDPNPWDQVPDYNEYSN